MRHSLTIIPHSVMCTFNTARPVEYASIIAPPVTYASITAPLTSWAPTTAPSLTCARTIAPSLTCALTTVPRPPWPFVLSCCCPFCPCPALCSFPSLPLLPRLLKPKLDLRSVPDGNRISYPYQALADCRFAFDDNSHVSSFRIGGAPHSEPTL